MSTTSCIDLACEPSAPQRARAWAQRQLVSAPPHAGMCTSLIQDAMLCISELVTNALQASCQRMTLDLAIDHGRIRVVVTDNGHGWPTPQNPRPSDPRGRGLMIINAIAQSWGIEPSGADKAIWAEIAARN